MGVMTLNELSGLGQYTVLRTASGWAKISDHLGNESWVPMHRAQQIMQAQHAQSGAPTSGAAWRHQRREEQAATARRWWGDAWSQQPGVREAPPFDPRLGREVRNIREWQDLQRAKERAGVDPGVSSREDWADFAQQRRNEREAQRQRDWGTGRQRRDFAEEIRGDSTHDSDIDDLDAGRRDESLPVWKRWAYDREYRRRRALKRARDRARAERARRKKMYEDQQAAQGPPPSSWTTPRVTRTRYRSAWRDAGPSVSSGGTTITRVSTPGTFVSSGGRTVTPQTVTRTTRPTTGGGVTYGATGQARQPGVLYDAMGRPITGVTRGVARGVPGAPTAPTTAYSAGAWGGGSGPRVLNGLGRLAFSEGSILGGLSGLGG
jgi:hypothetical protein